ncbi:MAG: hypothetical protein UV73_C0018G0027 [Candidatus Gottesmanbacteria bacterium GW2011_GWA2_43_14]|uniref:PIN domain-containing protein n=1 Tax=Candidatus Gottesmanbacteria bacterium GW2011_GWA2_43_14 TaxID=1618443 RepID=A0A0G1DCJ2_9BACT|nr:MAG: hypothetical protein UV73_C0018G0027 [Candidatus Gottesmanbacteria bacterium GW2011_GWA2_43_14]
MKNAVPVVVDSSVIVKWLNSDNEKHLKQADKLLKDRQAGKISLYTLELAKYEVGNALIYKNMDKITTSAAISLLFALPINYSQMDEDMALDAGELAKEYSITYYDASFMVLAKYLKSKLVTDNPKHQKKQKDIIVIPIEKYH